MADKHSEVEAKFNALRMQVPDFIKYVADVSASGFAHLERYKEVAGDDTYYQQGEDNFLRHRYDGQRHLSIFTVKRRKSQDSIADRHEIDLPLADDVDPETAAAFLKMTGWKPIFTINKVSYIAHMKVGLGYTACLALYDVHDASLPEAIAGWDRYLEIEIEKDSDISHQQCLFELREWVTKLRIAFALDEPMNQSLFEIYQPCGECKGAGFLTGFVNGVNNVSLGCGTCAGTGKKSKKGQRRFYSNYCARPTCGQSRESAAHALAFPNSHPFSEWYPPLSLTAPVSLTGDPDINLNGRCIA